MNNIKKIRKIRNMKVTELAERLNMSQSNLTKIENGQIELKRSLAEKIAAELDIAVSALYVENEIETVSGGILLPLLNPNALSLPEYSQLSLPMAFIPTAKYTGIYVMDDDAMQPLINKKSLLLLIEKESETKVSDGIYLLNYNNRYLLRRIQHISDTDLLILSDNPSYPPIPATTQEVEIIARPLATLSCTIL